jgi:DNA-binding NarL/FixJ family response regulator
MDPHVKAIVSSGYSEGSVMANFRQYGFSGVLAKPYSMTELSEVLRRVLAE